MRAHPVETLAFAIILVLGLAGCKTGPDEHLGIVTAEDLAGTYTGVLQGVNVAYPDDINDPYKQIVVDMDLLHELSIREVGKLTVRMESSIVPPLRAFVVGVGPVAINAEFIEFEGLDFTDVDPRVDALKVKQIVFVQHEGEWILVLQLIRVGIESQDTADGVYVYQYVSYPSRIAQRMSEEEAIQYVNLILRLASAAQRL